MFILTPHWFDDSIQAGCRVPELPYSWPDPEVFELDMGHEMVVAIQCSAGMVYQLSVTIEDY